MSVMEMLQARPDRLYRFTVDQYHRLMESGLIPSGAPYELIEGQIVRKIRSAIGEDDITINPGHVYALTALTQLAPIVQAYGHLLRLQVPITVPPDHEPEPDAAIVVGDIRRYRDRHPLPAEVICAIEVSDSSLRDDQSIKYRVYARAGIATYCIVNLIDRQVEVHTSPDSAAGTYADSRSFGPGDSFTIRLSSDQVLSIAVDELLP